jgi:DNA topoisomerase-3
MTLYICEKPSQARDIARLLNCAQKGEGYLTNGTITVSWCFGHLVETAEPAYYRPDIKPWRLEILPILPVEWHLQIKASCKKQFTILKGLIKNNKKIVIATDADREGELIAREILTLCNYKGDIKRLWLSALDDASIQKALKEIKDGKVTEALYYAGLGRQRADWLIGMNMTMAASVLFGKYGEGVVSVGRVQTPTLKLIVARDLAIENFKPKDYFELIAQFTTAMQESFYAKWSPPKSECDEEGRCLNKFALATFAAKVKGKAGSIEKYEDKHKTQSPPLCFSLSQLQKLASSRLGLSAQNTLDIAQSLYETHKALTYPRTDCGYLPENQLQDAPAILNNLKTLQPAFAEFIEACDVTCKSPTWNDKKITAHHGIIPTLNLNVNVQKMQADEKAIYDLVCRYYIAQFLGDYHYAQRNVTVQCEGEMFKAASHTPLKLGWKHILQAIAEKESDEADDHLSTIPVLQIKEEVQHLEEKILTKQTRPPQRFTEGTLIEAMKSIGRQVDDARYQKILKETAGIGTEATRASIIETLFRRQYVEKKGKGLFSTPKGQQLIAALPAIVADPMLTAEWEGTLDQVAQGQLKLDSFLVQQQEHLHQMLNVLKAQAQKITPVSTSLKASPSLGKHKATANIPCELCGKPLVRRLSKQHKNYFWGCSTFPTCRHTVRDHEGQPSTVVHAP